MNVRQIGKLSVEWLYATDWKTDSECETDGRQRQKDTLCQMQTKGTKFKNGQI